MKFKFADQQFSIQFAYGLVATTYGTGRRGVHCMVTQEREGIGTIAIVAKGYAACAPEDKYIKETGRKIALTNALTHSPKIFREAVWKAYFGRKDVKQEAAHGTK